MSDEDRAYTATAGGQDPKPTGNPPHEPAGPSGGQTAHATPAYTAPPGFRAGYAALIGEPNVGKSTLLNALLGQKISIVTPKPQTTRHKVLGILTREMSQVIFLDTPGLITPRYALHKAMMASASSAMTDADLLLLLIDVSAPPPPDEHAGLFARFGDLGKPVFLVLNKVDLAEKPALLPLIGSWAARYPFTEVFPVSALKQDGTASLLEAVDRGMPVHPPYYPPDSLSDQNDRFFVAEILREKILLKTHEEVPYATAVDILEFKERQEGKWYISAEVTVERESQKAILIGRKGAKLKEIGRMARTEMESFLNHPVFLEIHVKVRGKWRTSEDWVKRLGYRD